MKRIVFVLSAIMVLSSCATTKETKSARTELKNEKKLAKQETVGKAVESKRYIIKFDKLYFSRGGIVDLLPKYNYIIIDGDKAIISAAYIGKQFDMKPIAGINMRGISRDYELTNNSDKGTYNINMKVNNRTNSFNVFLSITKDGRCRASFSSLMIDNVTYRGHIVPIKDKKVNTDTQNQQSISI